MDKLKEVAVLFFKLGVFAFGGPAAHIAMMEDEIVQKRKWMTREHFLDLLGITNLIPGPNSTEMAIHCGFHRAGWAGLVAAGICFIFPAVVLTGLLAHVYVTYGDLPNIEPFFYGIRPAVLAIILSAIIKLNKKAYKNWQLGVIGIIVMGLVIAGLNEVVAILGGGIIGAIWLKFSVRGKQIFSSVPLALPSLYKVVPVLTVIPIKIVSVITASKIFLVFLKIGCVLFGSGYVLIAYLEGELVEKLGWLTQTQLLDAVAMGQFTPGPVLSTATFIGYQLKGIEGALFATLGIFLPSFILVALVNPVVGHLRRSKFLSLFLDAVNKSAVGVMLAVTYQLAVNSLVDWRAIVFASISTLVVVKFKKVNVVWIVLGGSFLGYVFALV